VVNNAQARHAASPTALFAGMGYLIITWILFFIGPYEWPLNSWWPVWLYVPFIFLILGLTHASMLARRPRHVPYKGVNRTIVFGAFAAIILLVPSGQIYAGRYPWQVLEALADQRDAYAYLREALSASAGARGPIVLARSLTAPFVFAVLPLGVIYWGRLSNTLRALVIATVLSNVIFSILRGTTRELADMLVVAASAFLVGAGRNPARSFLLHHWGKIVSGGFLVVTVFTVMVGRAAARLGNQTISCTGETGVCANLTTGFYGGLSDSLAFASAMITGYLAQGYYGLSLAMTLPFEPTWGVGHSSAIESVYRNITNDPFLYQQSYTFRLRALGWSDEYQWSSLMVWLANDVSFYGVPVLIGLLGLGWGATWVDATKGQDDRAAIFFCVIMSMIFYLPANNQMMGVLENYAVLLFWAFSWGLSRKRAVRL
jgi:hypothetical protein